MAANQIQNIHNFDPTTSIPDLSSKVIIVTGGNSGVGKESITQLVKHKPKKIYLGARSQSKFDTALTEISTTVPDAASHIHFLQIDLSDFASIKSAADKFLSKNDRLDILMNNAGIMAAPPGSTTEGYEIQFGTNHMGTALLTKLLLPTLLKTAQSTSDVRIVNVSSKAMVLAPGTSGIPFLDDETKTLSIKTPTAGHRWTYTRYAVSKLGNVLHAQKLAALYGDQGLTAIAIHPGRVRTNLLNDRFSILNLTGWLQSGLDLLMGVLSVEKGALTQLWGATAEKSQILNGGYFEPVGVETSPGKARDEAQREVADRLWDWQEGEFERWLKGNGY